MSEAIAAMWKDVGVNVKVEVIEYSVRAQKNREKSFKGVWWADPTSTLGDPDGMMWRLLGPGGNHGLLARPQVRRAGQRRRFSVDEKFRGEAYREMTKVFNENFPWLPVIQPYEDYGLQKYVEFTPNPNQQFEIRASTSSSAARRAVPVPPFPGRERGGMRGFPHARSPPVPQPASPESAHRALAGLHRGLRRDAAVRRSGAPAPSARRAHERDHARPEGPGLDRPLPVQYAVFLKNIVRAISTLAPFREPAFSVVRGYLGATLELGLTAFFFAALVAVPWAPLGHEANTLLDQAAMGWPSSVSRRRRSSSASCSSWLLSLKADLFPTSGRGDWKNLVLPAMTLGAFTMASIAGSRARRCSRCFAPTISARARQRPRRGDGGPSTPCVMPPFPSSPSPRSSSAPCSAAPW